LGSERRIEMALGRHPGAIGEEIIDFVEGATPPTLKKLWRRRGTVRRLLAGRMKNVRRAMSQQVVEAPDLSSLPAIKCWPEDAGRFITFPLVLTCRPADGRTNLGIYRMQLYDNASTGMHWQLQKGGGFHYQEAEALGRPLEVAACLGGDPVLLLAAVLPLPEGLEELVFAGILRGKPTPMVRARSLAMRVPANAEFILEGRVEPGERAEEGPFGDHLGHYSHQAPFPVFRINVVTRRKDPVYPAAVVGKPPQEDRYLGEAAQHFLNPFVKLFQPEIEDLWAYYEAGFHNLLVVSVKSRYSKEPLKTALGLFGNGQLSLTKCIVLVGSGVDPRDFDAVLREVRRHYRAETDFLLLPRVPLDTLDFTSFKMHLGSKMAMDATPKQDRPPESLDGGMTADVGRVAPEAQEWRLVQDTMLAVKVAGGAREALARLARAEGMAGVKLIAAVSPDVDLHDRTSLLWGIFTRFDPARDVIFREMRWEGAAPVYRGPLAIDATFKQGYPAPLEMDPDIIAKVDRRWDEYWM
ncbi:MAG: UbiD family decarboxylase, partial [Dehalococcoidia bacterium]